MISWLKKWLSRISRRTDDVDSPRTNMSDTAGEPTTGRAYRIPREEDADPLRRMFESLFSARRAKDDEIHYGPVGSGGIFVARAEEWWREGNTLRGRTTRAFVVSCSGEITTAESLKVECQKCHGYDAVMLQCAACGKVHCRLHCRKFELPDGTTVILCEAHSAEAHRNFDTWAARDYAGAQSRRANE